jgi:hypothetical protein
MKQLFFFTAVILFSGCATTYKVSPIASTKDEIDIVYNKGLEIGRLVRENSQVIFYGDRNGKEITLRVYISNDSDRSINVFPDSITVYGRNSDGQYEQLETHNPERYMRRLQNMQNITLALQGLAAVGENINAGTTTTTTYGTLSSPSGTRTYYGYSQTVDENKRREAQQQSNEEFEKAVEQALIYREGVRQGLLMSTTLSPDGDIEGDLKVRYKKYEWYILEVPVGNDIHRIRFNLKR